MKTTTTTTTTNNKCLLTLCFDSIGVNGSVGAPGCSAGLQDVLAHPTGDSSEFGGLQDEGLPIFSQKFSSSCTAGERGHALYLLAGHVTTWSCILLERWIMLIVLFL